MATPEVHPVVPKKVHGALIYDVDGNVLIDFSGRAGLTGYTPDHLLETLRDGVENLIDFPGYTTSQAAIALSERLISLIPNAERVVLFNSESEMAGIADHLKKIDPNAIISDQQWHGFGRTGTLWALPEPPDAVLLENFAAGLPIAALVGRASLLDHIGNRGGYASPLACAAALSVIDYIITNDLPSRALQIAARIEESFAEWGHAEDVMTLGVRAKVWLNSREIAKQVYDKALQNGLILQSWGGGDLRLEPPLMCPEEQLNEALDVLRDALDW